MFIEPETGIGWLLIDTSDIRLSLGIHCVLSVDGTHFPSPMRLYTVNAYFLPTLQ